MNKIKRLSKSVYHLLKEQGRSLVTAESCTGGGIGAAVTSIPGSSDVYYGGYVTYANEAKIKSLGVSGQDLHDFGAVSETIARQMAEGALESSNADYSIAVTGIAGPGGGSQEKPVGTVFIGVAVTGRESTIRRYQFTGNREAIRNKTIIAALEVLEKIIKKHFAS